MIFKRCILLSVLCLLCGSEARWLGPKLKLPEPDNELHLFIKNATRQAKIDFNNQLESTTYPGDKRSEFELQTFDDNFLKIGEHKIYLSELQVVGQPLPQLKNLSPDMMYNYMDADILWKEVVVDGKYELHQKRGLYSISVIKGEIRLIWRDTKAHGNIAFLPFDYSSSFYSTNYDLDFKTGKAEISFINEREENNEILVAAGEDVKNLLQDDLFWKLQENVRHNIDTFLQTQSVYHTFNNNDMAVQKYRSYTTQTQLILNSAVDEVFKMVKGGVSESGNWKFAIPEIYEGFSENIWFVTFWGHVRLWNGEMKDLRTLRRRTDFSLIVKDDIIELTGSADLTQLAGGYRNYDVKFLNIGPSGSVSMTVNNNAFSFKLRLQANDGSTLGYKVLSQTFKVHLDNIKISITGLGILDWLVSIISTFVINCFKGEISQLIENEVSRTLDGWFAYIS